MFGGDALPVVPNGKLPVTVLPPTADADLGRLLLLPVFYGIRKQILKCQVAKILGAPTTNFGGGFERAAPRCLKTIGSNAHPATKQSGENDRLHVERQKGIQERRILQFPERAGRQISMRSSAS